MILSMDLPPLLNIDDAYQVYATSYLQTHLETQRLSPVTSVPCDYNRNHYVKYSATLLRTIPQRPVLHPSHLGDPIASEILKHSRGRLFCRPHQAADLRHLSSVRALHAPLSTHATVIDRFHGVPDY